MTELTERLTNGTVLGDWFSPMDDVLDKVRFSDKPPLARSTYSDALASPHRLAILRSGVEQLVSQVQQHQIVWRG